MGSLNSRPFVVTIEALIHHALIPQTFILAFETLECNIPVSYQGLKHKALQ